MEEVPKGVEPIAKPRSSAKGSKAKSASPAAQWVLRAEVVSADTFSLILDAPKGPGGALQIRVRVLKELDDIIHLETILLEEELAEANRCELDASDYLSIHEALVGAGRHLPGGFFYWRALPEWVIEQLPSFSGTDVVHEQPTSVWFPEGLMPYQKTALNRAMVQGGRVLLADEMGLGKTAEALSVMSQYLEKEGPALIITPPSLGAVWRCQLRRWLPEIAQSDIQLLSDVKERFWPRARVAIMSYSLFARKPQVFSQMADGQPWRLVICDEAHWLRNPTSQRSKALLPVLHAAQRVILATGTPTPKQASEAYVLLHALRPLRCSFKEWSDRYAAGRKENHESEVPAMLAEVMVRHMKADVLEQLPPRCRQRVELQLPAGAAAAVRKLQEDCTDDQHFKQLARLKEAAAQEYIEYLLDASCEKFVLFAHHRAMMNALQSILEKRKVGFIRIDGSTPVADRAGLVQRFQQQASCQVAILSVLAAGEGLTFTSAALCVFCELCPAVPGVIEQAEARIHRIGQQASRVDIHFLVVDGTRDDRVFARLESRTDAVAQAIGDVASDAGADTTPFAASSSVEDAPVEKDLSQANADISGKRRLRQSKPATDAMPAPEKKKRRKQAFDLGSMLDQEIIRAQAGIEECPSKIEVHEVQQEVKNKPIENGASAAAEQANKDEPMRDVKDPSPAVADDEDFQLKLFAMGSRKATVSAEEACEDDMDISAKVSAESESGDFQTGTQINRTESCTGRVAAIDARVQEAETTGSRKKSDDPSLQQGSAEKEDPLSAMLNNLIDSARAAF